MGKATITGGGADGHYTAIVRFRRDTIDAQISELEIRADKYRDIIDTMEEGQEKNMLKAQLLGAEKRIQFLGTATPEDTPISVWCADLTEDLSGEVGLVEVPGQTQFFNIHPGYGGAAVYNINDHGFLMPVLGLTAAQAYANLGLLPAWQKWKPTFRYGAITSLSGDVCDIALEAATSTQRGLDVNQGTTLSSVPISYMDCDGVAFAEGDSVLIKFNGQDFASPKVIGFKDTPKPCGGEFLYIFVGAGGDNWAILWDVEKGNTLSGVTNNEGDPVSFPVLSSEITNWMASKNPTPVSGAMSFGGSESIAWQATENVYCGNCVDDFDPGCTYSSECVQCDCEVSGSNSVHSSKFVDSEGNKNGTQYYSKDMYCKGDVAFIPFGGHRGGSGSVLEIPGRVLHRVKSKTSIPGERGFIRESYEAIETRYYQDSTTEDCIGPKLPNDDQMFLDYLLTWRTPFFGDDDNAYNIKEWTDNSGTLVPQRTKTELTDEVIQFISEMSEKNLFIFKKHASRTSYSENTTTGTPLEVVSYENQINTVITIHIATAAEGSTPHDTIDPYNVPRHLTLTSMVQSLVNAVKIPSTNGFVDSVTTSMYLYDM